MFRLLVAATVLSAVSSAAAAAQSPGAATPVPTSSQAMTAPRSGGMRVSETAAMGFRSPAGQRDSVWNGLLVGAAVGAGYGMVIAPPQFCGTSDAECSAIVRVVIGLPSIAGGAAIGALVDYFVRDDSPSVNRGWRRLEVAPIAGRRVRGLAGRVRF